MNRFFWSLLGAFCCVGSVLHAIPSTEKASEEFTWKWEFNEQANTNASAIDSYRNDATAGFGGDGVSDWIFEVNSPVTGKSAKTDGNGILKLITPEGATKYGYLSSMIWKYSDITKTTGWTMEIRVKVIEDNDSWGMGIALNPNDASLECAKGGFKESSFFMGIVQRQLC